MLQVSNKDVIFREQKVMSGLRLNFIEGSWVVKQIRNLILMAIWIMTRPWWKFALSKCVEYDDWMFGGKGASPDGNVNEWWRTMLTLQIRNPGIMGVMSCPVGNLCSLSALVKRFQYIGIFYCFSNFGTILIILYFFRTSDCYRKSPRPHHIQPPNSTHIWTLI